MSASLLVFSLGAAGPGATGFKHGRQRRHPGNEGRYETRQTSVLARLRLSERRGRRRQFNPLLHNVSKNGKNGVFHINFRYKKLDVKFK